jgi:hypothetical protein
MTSQFLNLFIQSPYALSISFMKDPSLLGKNDELGVSKFKLNLDEELVQKFYERLMQVSIHESHMEDRNPDELLPTEIFEQFPLNIRDILERACENNVEDLSSEQIVEPIILRGLLILLMSPELKEENGMEILANIIKSFEFLIQNDKNSLYLERYLTQLSKDEFLNSVDKIHSLIDIKILSEDTIP